MLPKWEEKAPNIITTKYSHLQQCQELHVNKVEIDERMCQIMLISYL